MRGTDSRIREAALNCVEIIAKNDEDVTSVYAFDIVYGEGSGTWRFIFF